MLTLASDNDSLLQSCLRGNGDFFALAAQHGLSLDQFIAWFHSDATQRRLRDLATIADARTALLSRLNRAAAITRLTQVINAPHATLNESVRAAAAILRTARDFERREAAAREDEKRSANTRGEVPESAASSANSSSVNPSIQGTAGVPRALPRLAAFHPDSQPYPLADSKADLNSHSAQSRDLHLEIAASERASFPPAPPIAEFKPAACTPAFQLGTPSRSPAGTGIDFTRAKGRHSPNSPNLGPPVFAGV